MFHGLSFLIIKGDELFDTGISWKKLSVFTVINLYGCASIYFGDHFDEGVKSFMTSCFSLLENKGLLKKGLLFEERFCCLGEIYLILEMKKRKWVNCF